MGLARARSVVLTGVQGMLVEIEAYISAGLPSMNIVGLGDTAVAEARDRVRAAVSNSKLSWPSERKITVGLSPASQHKKGSGLDLGIALAILAANGEVPEATDLIVVGELALDGKVRPTPGVLVAALTAYQLGFTKIMVPINQLTEAQLVPDLAVIGVSCLRDATAYLKGEEFTPSTQNDPTTQNPQSEFAQLDLSDVRGQPMARRALEIAAAGGHHLALMGSPGVGKTMLAQRLPTLLPELDDEMAVAVTAIHSAAGTLIPGQGLIRTAPFQAPHHTATSTALIGGGSSFARIGMVTLAHGGVLCVDEAAEFHRPVLDALRQPLETGEVTISRSGFSVVLPAKFQLVLASNPCPCGKFVGTGSECSCAPQVRRRYLARLSGPLLDRIDIRVTLNRPTLTELEPSSSSEQNSNTVAQRVAKARTKAANRLAKTPWRLNAQVPGPVLRRNFPLSVQVRDELLKNAKQFSARGVDRTIRLAWTIADLADHETPTIDDLTEALIFRDGNGSWQI